MNIESTVDNPYLTENIIGFAGNGMEPRDKVRRVGEVTRVERDEYTLILYHNPVVKGYHRAQDAVGVCFDDDSLKFGLADGVSIVGGALDNKSGQMAQELVVSIDSLGLDWKRELYKQSEVYKQEDFPGASTVVWGSLDEKDMKRRLKLLTVGENIHLGVMKLVTQEGSLNFENKSEGFVPRHYLPHVQEMLLSDAFSLVFSSDGILPDEDVFWDILSYTNDKSVESLRKNISDSIRPQKDDQSLIIVSRIE